MLKLTCAILGIAVFIAVGFCGASQPVAPGHPYLVADGPYPPPDRVCWPWDCANPSGGALQPVAPPHPYLVADGPQPPPDEPQCWPWNCAKHSGA
jgi:hypothetical protein